MGFTTTTQADIDFESALAQLGFPTSVIYRLSKALPVVRRDLNGAPLGIEVDGELMAGSGVVNLGATPSTTQVVISNTSGTGATIPESTNSTAGVMSASNTLKLDGIAPGATANSPDATLLDRANHMGTQLVATISDLPAYVAAQIASSLISGNIDGGNANSVYGGVAPFDGGYA